MNKEQLEALVVVRPYTDNDLNFIYNAWLRSYRNHPSMKLMSNDVYFSNHKQTLNKLITSNHVDIICNKEDPDQIFGFMCYGEQTPKACVLHYIYVKYNYRRLGIGTYLLSLLDDKVSGTPETVQSIDTKTHSNISNGTSGDTTCKSRRLQESSRDLYTTHQPTPKVASRLFKDRKIKYNPYI